MHPGDLAGGFSDLEMTWLLYYAGAATGYNLRYPENKLYNRLPPTTTAQPFRIPAGNITG